jgi:hypothetical protein
MTPMNLTHEELAVLQTRIEEAVAPIMKSEPIGAVGPILLALSASLAIADDLSEDDWSTACSASFATGLRIIAQAREMLGNLQ